MLATHVFTYYYHCKYFKYNVLFFTNYCIFDFNMVILL